MSEPTNESADKRPESFVATFESKRANRSAGPDSISYVYPFLSGALLALAWWVRTSEIFWTALLAMVLFIVFWKFISWKTVLAFSIGAVAAFSPAAVLNHQLYGNMFRTAYQATTQYAIPANSFQSPSPTSISRSLLFPFGLHPRTAITDFWQYFIALPWGISIATIASLLWLAFGFLRRNRSSFEVILLLVFLGVTGWLAAVYGSWVIHDNPNPNVVTIGNSYLRYWLPAFVLGTAVIGIATQALSQFLRQSLRIKLFASCYLLLATLSFHLVFRSEGDGLMAITQTLKQNAAIKTEVIQSTPFESIFIVDRADKIFFPERKVITPLRDESTYAVLSSIAAKVPLYYFGITMTPEDLRYHNGEKLRESGLVLEFIKQYGDSSLYRFVRQGQ